MALLLPHTAEDEPGIRLRQDSGPWLKSSRVSGRSFDQRGEVGYVVGERVTSCLAGGFVYAANRIEFAVSHDWGIPGDMHQSMRISLGVAEALSTDAPRNVWAVGAGSSGVVDEKLSEPKSWTHRLLTAVDSGLKESIRRIGITGTSDLETPPLCTVRVPSPRSQT